MQRLAHAVDGNKGIGRYENRTTIVHPLGPLDHFTLDGRLCLDEAARQLIVFEG